MDARPIDPHFQPSASSTMQPFEIIETDETVAACNGGGGPLGHPRVYLNLAPAGKIECPYCSRLFVLRGHGASSLPHTPDAPKPSAKGEGAR
jgi:uncharacterized Zn-finger protein